MKNRPSRNPSGFTLIELLVVIAIIGILAGMLLPAISAVQQKAKRAQCQKDVAELEGAINAYNSDYSRLPTSPETRKKASDLGNSNPDWSDLYFGFVNGNVAPKNIKPSGYSPASGFNPLNTEVVLILMNQTNGAALLAGGGMIAKVNENFAQNPKHQTYLNAKQVNGPAPGGVDLSLGSLNAGAGSDINKYGLYRDPWGNPYCIVLDMDYDNRCLSPFPDFAPGSTVPAKKYINRPVLVFSTGRDGSIDTTKGKDDRKSVNADNIYSW
ncbi:MAG TPA: type II secretion system protein [Candidatus Limnocylindria bacterium]|nr:type II secretion system protein [Candidatus Limnocylindria bacterium]